MSGDAGGSAEQGSDEPSALTVLIVHRNQPERCAATLASFADQDVPVDPVVLDNDSTPEALARLRALAPDAAIVPTGGNLGFGPAANVGWRAWLDGSIGTAGDAVALCPHDALPDPGCLRRLLDALAENRRVGLVSAEYGTDELPFWQPFLGALTLPAERGTGFAAADYAHGTLLIARRRCLEEVGLFDERYFAYCEEADLGVRARAAGWEVGIVWSAVVVNPETSSTRPVGEYLQLRNTLFLIRRHSGRYPAIMRMVTAVVSTAWLTVRRSRRPAGFSHRARGLAMMHYAIGRGGPPPESLFPSA